MKNSEKGILWDLDGVLFDTTELHYHTWYQTLQAYDIRLTREMFKDIFGMKNDDFMAKILGEELEPDFITQLSNQKEQLFRKLVPGRVDLMPGAQDLLEQLQSKGFRQAIASSAPQANVDTLVDQAGIRRFFSAIVSSAGLPGKPDPAVFLKAASSIEVPPEKCIVVEDAIVGVEAAKRAGMKCIAVTSNNPAEALEAADQVVSGLDALPVDTFEQLLNRNGHRGD